MSIKLKLLIRLHYFSCRIGLVTVYSQKSNFTLKTGCKCREGTNKSYPYPCKARTKINVAHFTPNMSCGNDLLTIPFYRNLTIQ